MKKIVTITVIWFAVMVSDTISGKSILFAQTVTDTVAGSMSEVGLLNVNRYSSFFLKNNQLDIKYELASTDFDYYDKVAALGGNSTIVDTALEIALLSYSAGVINVRPVQAEAMLPANNPKLADLKLGAALYQNIQISRFLADNSVGRYEGMLKFITDKGNVTRADVEAFYRNGVRALVSDMVDEYLAILRVERPPFNVPTARLAEVKRAITDFMLNPSSASYAELLATYRRNAGETAILLGYTMTRINSEVSDALTHNRRLGSQQ